MEKRADFSVATKIWLFFCMVIATNFITDYRENILLASVGFLYLFMQKKRHLIRSFALSYGVFSLLMIGIRFYGWRTVLISEFQILFFWNLFPTMMISWDLIHTPPGQISAFLSAIRMPIVVILGVLVIFRFVPTMRSELRKIRQSMKNRGLLEFREVIAHPIHTAEYVLIPLLLRCIQIADRLSVSAMTRGASCPVGRNSYYENKCGVKDFLWMFFGIMVLMIVVSVKDVG